MTHPLISSYISYVKNDLDFRVGVIGQVDAGKSALIKTLTQNDAYISTETDATRELKAYPYKSLELIDFPGVGTKEFDKKSYIKYIKKSGIKKVFYVFSSKIHDEDEAVIQFLSKAKIDVTFVYNKTDSLVDITGAQNLETLKHSKNTELHLTFKKWFNQPLSYYFVSVRSGEGIEYLIKALDMIEEEKRNVLNQKLISRKYIDKFLNKRTQTLATQIISPSVKELLVNKEYQTIEDVTLETFELTRNDAHELEIELPNIMDYINKAKIDHKEEDMNNLISQLISVMSTVFKLRKLNVVTFVMSFVIETGIKNVYPALRGTLNYVQDVKEFARTIIKHKLIH